MNYRNLRMLNPNRHPKGNCIALRNLLITTIRSISVIGAVAFLNFSLIAQDSIAEVEFPSWTTEDFYQAIEENDAEQVQEYLADTERTTQEFLSYYLLDYALELERYDIALLMVVAGAGVNTLPAVQHKNMPIFERMLKRGVEPRGASLAAEQGNIDMLKSLLEHGEEEFNTRGAALHGQSEAIKLLLDHGAKPEGLEIAILHGHEEVAKLLLESGAETNYFTQFPRGWRQLNSLRGYVSEHLTPLHYAVLSQSLEVVEELLQAGADPNLTPSAITFRERRDLEEDPWPSVLRIARDFENGNVAITQMLEKHGATLPVSIDDDDVQLEKDLFKAAKKGDEHTVLQLLEAGAEPTVFRGIHYSFMGTRWNPKIIQAFLEAGVDPDDYSDGYPYTPAGMALTNGDLDNFKRLIRAGAKTDEFMMKFVYMRIACIEGLNEAIEYLWNQGVRPGLWELLSPVNYGHVHTVEFMLDRGMRPWALRDAVEKEHVEIVRHLLEAGADPNKAEDYDEKSILELAVESENDDIISMLKQVGAKE